MNKWKTTYNVVQLFIAGIAIIVAAGFIGSSAYGANNQAQTILFYAMILMGVALIGYALWLITHAGRK